MQSEFACHIGLRGKLFCRACWVKGPDAFDEARATQDTEQQHGSDMARNSSHSNEGSEAESMADSEASGGASASSDNSEGGAARGAQKKSRKQKAVETMSQLLRRASDFIKVVAVIARARCSEDSHLIIFDSDLDRQASSQTRDRREAR